MSNLSIMIIYKILWVNLEKHYLILHTDLINSFFYTENFITINSAEEPNKHIGLFSVNLFSNFIKVYQSLSKFIKVYQILSNFMIYAWKILFFKNLFIKHSKWSVSNFKA